PDRCRRWFSDGERLLILDRDPRFSLAFRETLATAAVQVVRLPARSPNLNAYAERFVRTIKESCWTGSSSSGRCRSDEPCVGSRPVIITNAITRARATG